MFFNPDEYPGLITESSAGQKGLFNEYNGESSNFDLIIIGSGMGGGILADRAAELYPHHKILVLEGGSYLYPTHVYNCSRFLNYKLAGLFGVDTYSQLGDENSDFFIGEKTQLNFGGRSIFWSGLIPELQEWELDFFPQEVRDSLASTYLDRAGELLNESRSLGDIGNHIVNALSNDPILSEEFIIEQTPRALHQPYLKADGTPRNKFFQEPTGVFNTAELLSNQSGPAYDEGRSQYGSRLNVRLNSFVEYLDRSQHGWYGVQTRNTANGEARKFWAPKVVIAAGSLESPKILERSSFYKDLPEVVHHRNGIGLTDHPTTRSMHANVDNINGHQISKDDHAKILLYSKGKKDAQGRIKYPFNIEMNINHEFWHLRNNDVEERLWDIQNNNDTILDIKFSFANCLDNQNKLWNSSLSPFQKGVQFRNHKHFEYLAYERFPAVANWDEEYYRSFPQVPNQDNDFGHFCYILNELADRIASNFKYNGQTAGFGESHRFGKAGDSVIGYGTVHHAIGTMRMPYKENLNSNFNMNDSVVDQDLMVRGADNLYVCDMSVMPFSSAANPVRTLAALSIRLAEKLNL